MKLQKISCLVAAAFLPSLVAAMDIAELEKLLQQPQNVQGTFVQQRYLKSLSKPMTTGGRFVLQPQKGLLWQMQKPFAVTLRVTPSGMAQWNGKSWAATGGNAAAQAKQVRLFLDLLGGNTDGLKKQFDMRLDGTPKQWQLRLNPKTALMKQVFDGIEIRGDRVVRQVELNEKQGDRTVMKFGDQRINSPLDAFAAQALR